MEVKYTSARYALVQDDSGSWYVIPADRVEDWETGVDVKDSWSLGGYPGAALTFEAPAIWGEPVYQDKKTENEEKA